MNTSLAKILLAVCLPLSVSLASATDYDFQSQTAGTATSGSGITVFGGTSPAAVMIASSATTPADPFGGTNNQSLYISSSTAASTAQAQLSLSSTPITSGTLTFSLYIIGTDATPGIVEVDLGQFISSSASQRGNSLVALQFWTNSANTGGGAPTAAGHFLGFMGGSNGSSNLYAFNQNALINAVNTVSISWDATANTYSVLLNNVMVTQGTSPSIVSSFAQTTEQAGVTDVRFTTSNAAPTSYFIDNVTVTSAIPEPATTAVMVGLVAGLVAFCGRRFASHKNKPRASA